ncbi:MAG TPA: hypothetical protein VEG60_17845 [Candidatus Binatia bacterium]|nr:hypothetical protein [Candidatus Binatia bacterium]
MTRGFVRWIIILVGFSFGGVTNLLADYSRPQVGTAIIAIVRPESRIVLAADSRRLIYPLDEAQPRLSVVCKISKLSDSIFFVPTGFYAWQSFRAPHIIRQAYEKTQNIGKTVELIESRLKAALETNYLEIRNNSPDFYRRNFDRMKKLEVFFFGAQFGTLFTYDREFRARNLPDKIQVDVIRHKICPGNWCEGKRQLFVIFAGHKEAISQHLKYNPIGPKLAEEIGWINNAMDAQIEAAPLDVGAPINIISIEPTGETQWIQGEDQCKF